MKTDVEDVKEDIEDVKDDVDDIEDDIEDVKDDMECVKSDIETVKSDVDTVKSDVMMVKSDVETVKGDVDTVKNDVKNMKSDIDMMKNNTGIVKSEIETIKSDVWMVKSEVETMTRCVDRMKSMKSDVDSIKSELENAMETTKQDMETVKSNLTGLYIKLEQVQQICSGTELQTPPKATPTPLIQPPSEPSDPGYICNGTYGWKQVVYLNMTDTSHHCPTGWRETGYSRRTCGRASTSGGTCDSAIFPVGGMEYTRVCGRVVGYQFGGVSAFFRSSHDIESHYVNGLSLTHGSNGSREHIWTFAGGLAESGPRYSSHMCPCDGGTAQVPEFVGNDYFCESGINGPWISQWIFHPNDRLWDGMDCLPTSNCCTFNGPPYFVKDIGNSTTDDIEARICSTYAYLRYCDVAIELVELYVQ